MACKLEKKYTCHRGMSDLTMIISVHGNLVFLQRILEFYSDFDCKKIVADSSPVPLNSELEIPSNFTYVHCTKKLSEKLGYVAPMIDTKYSVVVDHDDLYSYVGLEKCLAALDEHSDWSSVNGQMIFHMQTVDGLVFQLKQTAEYLKLVDRGAVDDPVERVLNCAAPQFNGVNAVCRTDIFKRMYAVMPKFVSSAFYDRYAVIFQSIYGPQVTLPHFYCSRDHGSSLAEATPLGRIPFRTAVVSNDPVIADEYEEYIEVLSSEFSKRHGIPMEESVKVIKNCFLNSANDVNENVYHSIYLDTLKLSNDLDNLLSKVNEAHVLLRDFFGRPYAHLMTSLPVYQSMEDVKKFKRFLDKFPSQSIVPFEKKYPKRRMIVAMMRGMLGRLYKIVKR